jgi:hypothetical protein
VHLKTVHVAAVVQSLYGYCLFRKGLGKEQQMMQPFRSAESVLANDWGIAHEVQFEYCYYRYSCNQGHSYSLQETQFKMSI